MSEILLVAAVLMGQLLPALAPVPQMRTVTVAHHTMGPAELQAIGPARRAWFEQTVAHILDQTQTGHPNAPAQP